VSDRVVVVEHIINVIRKNANSDTFPSTENGLVEVMANLLEAVLWSLPVDIKVRVARYF